MIAAAAIVLGYLGIIQAFGWLGAFAALAHFTLVVLGTWRGPGD